MRKVLLSVVFSSSTLRVLFGKLHGKGLGKEIRLDGLLITLIHAVKSPSTICPLVDLLTRLSVLLRLSSSPMSTVRFAPLAGKRVTRPLSLNPRLLWNTLALLKLFIQH